MDRSIKITIAVASFLFLLVLSFIGYTLVSESVSVTPDPQAVTSEPTLPISQKWTADMLMHKMDTLATTKYKDSAISMQLASEEVYPLLAKEITRAKTEKSEDTVNLYRLMILQRANIPDFPAIRWYTLDWMNHLSSGALEVSPDLLEPYGVYLSFSIAHPDFDTSLKQAGVTSEDLFAQMLKIDSQYANTHTVTYSEGLKYLGLVHMQTSPEQALNYFKRAASILEAYQNPSPYTYITLILQKKAHLALGQTQEAEILSHKLKRLGYSD